MKFEDVVSFHGHSCPGLAMGYRMTMEALKKLGIEDIRSKDEELVAIVENDACGVDAVQCVAGCTFGKGNLIFNNWGKMAYTIIRRDTGHSIRVRVIQKNTKGFEPFSTYQEKITHILSAPVNDILYLESIHQIIPQKAAGLPSIGCSMCGEATMQTRTRESEHGPVCIPCAHQIGLSQPDNHSVHIKPEKLIKSLGLAPLPEEDGLFNEVYRSTETISEAALPNRYSGKRSFSTAIYYMLIPGVVSRKHRVKSDEIFHLYGGGPAKMIQIFADGTRKEFIIGMDIEAGQRPMVIVPAGVWQGMELLPGAAYALFGCTVAPGFDFDDFEM